MPPHPLPQNTLTTHIPISSTLSQRLWILRTLHLGHFISRVSLWPLWLRLVTWVNADLTSSVLTDPYNTADPGGQGVALPSLHLSTITDLHGPDPRWCLSAAGSPHNSGSAGYWSCPSHRRQSSPDNVTIVSTPLDFLFFFFCSLQLTSDDGGVSKAIDHTSSQGNIIQFSHELIPPCK